jgi:hypothetical protein
MATHQRPRKCGRFLALGIVLAAMITRASPAESETVIKVLATNRQAPSRGSETGEPTLVMGLARARLLRAQRRPGDPQASIVIELQPGIHRIDVPVLLGPEDGGTAVSPLVLRASGGDVRLSGGKPLRPLQPDAALLAKYPEKARPYLAVYAMPEILSAAPRALNVRRQDRGSGPAPFEIMDAKGPLKSARWPNAGWAPGVALKRADGSITVGDQGGWTETPTPTSDVWIAGFLKHDWDFQQIALVGRDLATGGLVLEETPQFGYGEKFRFAIQHAANALDEPGEWHRDPATGHLVVWPRTDGGRALEASAAQSLLVLKGVDHVRIEGMTFEAARGDAIRIEGGNRIEIANATFRNIGGRAVVIEGASRSGIRNSRIFDTGDGGVVVSGGDRTALAPAGLYVVDTIIERFARLGLTYRPAIALHGVGNTARGNLIMDGPHYAIDFSGNDHVIALNEIAYVVKEAGDAGAIYTGRDWTWQGNVVTNNFLHDIRPLPGLDVKGVYLDDWASGTTVDGNVFLRVDQPVFIGGGRDNRVRGNLFVASEPGIHIDGRGLTWWPDAVTRPDEVLQTRLRAMPTATPLWRQRYPELSGVLSDEPQKPKRNAASGNVFLGGAAYRLLPEVDAKAQNLVPDADSRRIDAAIPAVDKRRIVEAQSAMELRAALSSHLEAKFLLSLPLEQMDRWRQLGAR